MWKYVSRIGLFVIGVAVLASCDDLLETSPSTEVDPDTAQESVDGIEAIMTSVYNRLQSQWRYGREITLGPDVLADNAAQHPVTSGRYDGMSVNSPGSHISFWNTGYLTINEANYVIEGADQVEDAGEETRQRLRGEALFQRGFVYFDFARTYGYEPDREVDGWTQSAIIRTEPTRDVGDADLRSRSTNEEVYSQALEDLEEAVDLLEGIDRGVFFANYAGGHALLARLNLYLENWQDAVDHAEIALAETGAELLTDESDFADSNPFDQVPNPESIMELNIDPVEESLGSNVGLCPYTNPTHWHDVMPSQDLIEVFDEEDYRLNLIGEADDGHPYSRKWDCSTGAFDDNVPLVRVPEMYLIMAEAHAELGQWEDAHDALNTLREARGLDPVSGYNDAESFIVDEVFPERRRELHFEGHRFYDLKRRAMDIPKQEDLPDLPYDDYRVLSYIPSGEVDNNPNLDNNPGY